jgi:hypothetical protein
MGESATTSVSNYIKAWLSAQRIIWKEIIENWLKNITLTIIAIRPECSSFHNTINWVEEVVLFCHFPPLSWLNPIGKLCCADYLEHFGHVVCTLPEGKTSRHSSKLLCTRGRGGGGQLQVVYNCCQDQIRSKAGEGTSWSTRWNPFDFPNAGRLSYVTFWSVLWRPLSSGGVLSLDSAIKSRKHLSS